MVRYSHEETMDMLSYYFNRDFEQFLEGKYKIKKADWPFMEFEEDEW